MGLHGNEANPSLKEHTKEREAKFSGILALTKLLPNEAEIMSSGQSPPEDS